MKTVTTIARYLLGLMFTVFGLNGFLNFIPMPKEPPPPLVGQFMGALMTSHYMTAVFAIQLVAGILFLLNRYVALALTLIGPIIVNILLFHGLMQPATIAPGLVATLCWAAVFYRFRSAFAGIFRATEESEPI